MNLSRSIGLIVQSPFHLWDLSSIVVDGVIRKKYKLRCVALVLTFIPSHQNDDQYLKANYYQFITP